MDLLERLASREALPAECFELRESEIRFQGGAPVRAIVYRLKRRGLAMMLRDYQRQFNVGHPRERLGLQALLVRLDCQNRPWACLSWEEPLRNRLYRLWNAELAGFRSSLSHQRRTLESRLPVQTSEPQAWEHTCQTLRQDVDQSLPSTVWIVTPHHRAELSIGDVLAVIDGATDDLQQAQRIIERVNGWQQWYGTKFTFARRWYVERGAGQVQSRAAELLPWLHPPWSRLERGNPPQSSAASRPSNSCRSSGG